MRLRGTLAHVRGFLSAYLSEQGDLIRLIDRNLAIPAPKDDAWEALEDVCCGTRMQCVRCGKDMPCMCEHLPT